MAKGFQFSLDEDSILNFGMCVSNFGMHVPDFGMYVPNFATENSASVLQKKSMPEQTLYEDLKLK